ncbi:MAG: BON domain-containing protein [Candidatus Competibacteraceae bacterium]
MHKLHLTLAFLAALVATGCASMGGGSSDNSTTSVASLSDSGRGSPKISDSEIVAAIKDAYKQDEQLASANISVTATQGVVTLSGSVPSAPAYNRAISLARSVTGRPPVAADLKF